MAAFCEVVADQGLNGLTVKDIVSHVGVSRTAFYDCFDDVEGCADAAYERFIAVLLDRLVVALDPTKHWIVFVESGVRAYLETLQADPVVARALQIEMDAAGKAARVRRREALGLIAAAINARHETLMAEDPSFAPVPVEAHLALIYGVRQLACDALDTEDDPDLMRLVEPTVQWIWATVHGASSISELNLSTLDTLGSPGA